MKQRPSSTMTTLFRVYHQIISRRTVNNCSFSSAFTVFIMVGINRSYSTFLIPQLRLPTSVIPISDDEQYWIENLNTYTTPSGCLIGGIIADVLGRKVLLISTLLSCVSGWLIICAAVNVTALYVGIVLNSISSGMAFCTVVYIAEICSHDNRSIFMNMKEPLFAIGVIGSNLLIKHNGWRLAAYCYTGLAFGLLLLQCFLPESPSWLIAAEQRVGKATVILNSIRYSKTEAEKEILDMEAHYVNGAGENNRKNRLVFENWKDLLHCRKQFAVMFGLILLQQTSGINVLSGCTVILYDVLRIPYAQLTTFVHSASGFLVSFVPFVASLYEDRKNCLITSALGMTMAACLLAAYETKKYGQRRGYYEPNFWIVLTGVYAYYFFASIAVLIQPSVMSGEIFPSHVTGLACGICGCVAYVAAILSRYLYIRYADDVGLATVLWVMAFFSFLNVPFAKYILPETQDKTLHQIQMEYFHKRK